MRDFDVCVFGDCCTTVSDEDQAAALHALQRYGFARVEDSSDLVLGDVPPESVARAPAVMRRPSPLA